jgi:hypothetical protein
MPRFIDSLPLETVERLTLDNFKEITKRFKFRRTKDQVARNLTHEQAFEEWKKDRLAYLRALNEK